VILVAGGTGRLGTELIPLLTDRGIAVRVLTRELERARQRVGEGPELVEGDVRNPHSLEAALKGVDSVVSAITGFGPGAPGPAAVDYEGNLNLIRASVASGVRRFVLLSVQGAAAGHPMVLMRAKHRAEEALRASRLDWTIVRPTAFMELWAGLVGDPIVNARKATVFGGGDKPINFNSVRDVARFVDLALVDPDLSKTVLEVGGPENLTFNQLVGQIELAAGRTAVVNHIPIPLMRLSRLLLRPFRPDIAGMIEAGIAFDTVDMSFDATQLQRRFPQFELTPVREVVNMLFQTGLSRVA
jgi:uncharacterized protein YbjT (DUF2867 family)